MCNRMSIVFFFQAEDGIRDLTVTGVQTCALPISLAGPGPVVGHGHGNVRDDLEVSAGACSGGAHASHVGRRSEEHTSEIQSQSKLVCRLLLEKKKKITSIAGVLQYRLAGAIALHH